MRFWVGVSAAFGAGTLIGIGLGTLLVEKKLKDEYEESSARMRRAYEAARIDAETPTLTEEDLIRLQPRGEGTTLEGSDIVSFMEKEVEVNVKEVPATVEVTVAPTQSDNPYHQAVHQTATTGIYASYAELSQEDYEEDDGRIKEQITMLYSDGEPIFFKDGAEADVSDVLDWVGGTIVDDMRKAVGEGNPTVYVRNNQTEVDYEVTFEQP